MNSLLTSRPKKLEDAITRMGVATNRSSIASLVESMSLLDKYVRDAVERDDPLDDVLIPLIEHSLKCKDSKHANQATILLNWLFQDPCLFKALASNLINLVSSKEDHYIALGWCTLVRDLVDYETSMGQHLRSGIRARDLALLRILSTSISRLSFIVCNGSVLQDGFELPTRLSLAAADCLLTLTQSIANKSLDSQMNFERSRPSKLHTFDKPVNTLAVRRLEQENDHLDVSSNIEMGVLLWENLEELITLVQKLNAWSRKSRPLHGKGAELVLRWLQGIRTDYGGLSDEAGSKAPNAGVLIVASCWKHYSMLLRLDDCEFAQRHDNLLDQYLSGIEFYGDTGSEECTENSRSTSLETRKFFLNCLALLLGRLDSKKLARIMLDHDLRISDVLLSQFCCADVEVVDEAACIFRLVFFKMAGGIVGSSKERETLLPKLLQLLDELVIVSREVTILLAQYCSLSADFWCVEQVLKRFASGNLTQRRNAAAVISEFIQSSPDSAEGHSICFMQDVANHLLDRLSDEDTFVRTHATELLVLIDPALVLPTLVRLVCSANESSSSAFSVAFVGILRHHNQNLDVINLLLDCLSNFSQSQDHPKASEDMMECSSKLMADRVFKLIPEWSKSVEDWTPLIRPLIEKTFAQPSNATIIKFLSYISDHLADSADLVLDRVLVQAKSQKEIDGSVISRGEGKSHVNSDMVCLQQMLFDRLCPLLIIKLLPLRVFDDLLSTIMYSQFLQSGVILGSDIGEYECLAAFLLNRAFHQFEFDSVRKLAAELCGRIHPQVLFPVVLSQLEGAVQNKDMLKMKACLFSICTSLIIRGGDSVSHPVFYKIERSVHRVLLWPSMDGDEVSKAQHGCIDCLALMICAELQVPITSEDSSSDRSSHTEHATLERTILGSVIDHLTKEKLEIGLLTEVTGNSAPRMMTPFRLCMANVLISACQKISESSKKTFVRKTFPRLIPFIQGKADPDVRAAGIQILFSSVYHLKLAILPFASDLLGLSLQSLREGTDEEKMAAAKLMASLMASDVAVIEKISESLLDARSVLSGLYMSDSSDELREICQKLLQCLTS
ncbi:hypothetical protein Dimus_029696 [Dionaea muscipula]